MIPIYTLCLVACDSLLNVLPNYIQSWIYASRKSAELSCSLRRHHVHRGRVRVAVSCPVGVQRSADPRLPRPAASTCGTDDVARRPQHRLHHVGHVDQRQQRTQRNAHHRRRHGRVPRVQPAGQGVRQRLQRPAELRHVPVRGASAVLRARDRQLGRQLRRLLRSAAPVPRRTLSRAASAAESVQPPPQPAPTAGRWRRRSATAESGTHEIRATAGRPGMSADRHQSTARRRRRRAVDAASRSRRTRHFAWSKHGLGHGYNYDLTSIRHSTSILRFDRAMRPFYVTAYLFWAAALRPK